MAQRIDPTRRQIIRAVLSAYGLAVAGVGVPTAAAAQRLRTPPQSQGPFYPTQLPLDRDNDLVTVAGRPGIAKGAVADVVGRILNERGRPITNARVEIWQCDANGRYRHPRDRRDVPLDPNFQGYGQVITGPDGALTCSAPRCHVRPRGRWERGRVMRLLRQDAGLGGG
jgi:protocatechuate 3,4-dioxygenase beta subunit